MININPLARDKFQERIRKGLLGPGSENIVLQTDYHEEIISDHPLTRYYTGILFPEKDKLSSQNEDDDAKTESETAEEDGDINEGSKKSDKDDASISKVDINGKLFKEKGEDDDLKTSTNNFFPTNIGLTFCVDKDVKEVEAEFSFGLYYQPVQKEIKVAINSERFQALVNDKSTFPFKNILKFLDGYMFLSRELKGYKGGRGKVRSGEFKLFDDFKYSDELKDQQSLKAQLPLFEQLIGRSWKRKEISRKVTINIPPTNKSIIDKQGVYDEKIGKDKFLRVGFTAKTYVLKNRTYIKIQMVNTSDKHPARKFSNKNENLNRKCLFQSNIRIKSSHLTPYKTYEELYPFDNEAETLNYLYKDVCNYGIGHNCSVCWDTVDTSPHWIETSFLPEHDVKDIENKLTGINLTSEENESINKSCDVYSLSVFGSGKQETIDNIKTFIEKYGDWIQQQKLTISADNNTEKQIIGKLYDNYERLRRNIKLLEDDVVYKAFQLANTAMFIQLILSKDSGFCGKDKMLSEIIPDTSYNDIDFFKNYDFKRLPFGRLLYRPFQLAFFLLNIEGIINKQSKSGSEIIDLLWFPTGGGKTEAYLAIAAFTIIWRRLNSNTGYDGTSVIMRYTLRLLTAQQFERASRLITALEFLRKEYKEILKDTPITIGLWVGMASTPNTVNEANKKIDEITEECNKGDKGDPEHKNVFQISACPWCGYKLINKNRYKKWDSGFVIIGSGKSKRLKIKCLNETCYYHNGLPVQVVDEMLYEDPPTLLFATIDKFAMLAWQESGHKFFNSLSPEKLPPDLIIQDELHLLNGPLGSITGIYESIIELLCTKNGKSPKIIASTATTRNTTEQVRLLYGGKEVNIFPPAGLSYKDSYFAKVADKESKRRYIGFMPTGKTSLDTQLQILAHLLVARMEVFKDFVGTGDYSTINNYWTVVSYYNSLKDVGRIYNKIGDEISNFTSTLQLRLLGESTDYTFNYYGLPNRVVELTSRIESPKIKQILKSLEDDDFNENSLKRSDMGNTYISSNSNIVDLALATNMISVGIDIERLNVMLINGQPKNIAEYIQASSRVGRQLKGLVVTVLDANRSRDKSHFEYFVPFHQAFYKSVEPISITPFTENTIDKMLTSLAVTYIRHIEGLAKNDEAKYFQPDMLDDFKRFIKKRFKFNNEEYLYFETKLDELSHDWTNKIDKFNLKNYKLNPHKKEPGLLKKPSDKLVDEDGQWVAMQSMREIDTSSFIRINLP